MEDNRAIVNWMQIEVKSKEEIFNNRLYNIKVWNHRVKNKNNVTISAESAATANGYLIDSNVLTYLKALINGTLPYYSPIYYSLLKFCFLASKIKNVVISTFALWELSRNDQNVIFSESTINENRIMELMEVVLTCQALDKASLIDYHFRIDEKKLLLLFNRYNATDLRNASLNYLQEMDFYNQSANIKDLITHKIKIHLEYLKICYFTQTQMATQRSDHSKIESFINSLTKANLPIVVKTFNLCIRALSDTSKDPELLQKFGSSLKLLRAIKPEQQINTAVDLFFGDFAYLIDGYIEGGTSYNTILITADRIFHLSEEDITTVMKLEDEGLPMRYDELPEYNFLSKKDNEAVLAYMDLKKNGSRN